MEIKRIIVIDEKIIDRLTDLVDSFIRKAGESDIEHKDAMAVIDTLVRTNKGALFGVFEGDRMVGYLAMETCLNVGRVISIVHHMYLDNSVKETGVFKDLVDTGIRWAEEMKAKNIYFSTRRNSKAFQRLLGEGWTIDSTVLGLKLCVL